MPQSEEILWCGHPLMRRNEPIAFILLVLLVPLGIGAIGLFVWWLIISHRSLTITNQRSIFRDGIFSTLTSEVRHVDVRNIQVHQNWVQRLFGTGRIGISSAAQGGIEIQIDGILDPRSIAELVRRCRDAAESGFVVPPAPVRSVPPQASAINQLQPEPAIFSSSIKSELAFWCAGAVALLVTIWLFAVYLPALAIVLGASLLLSTAAYWFVPAVRMTIDGLLSTDDANSRLQTLGPPGVLVVAVLLISFAIPSLRQVLAEKSRIATVAQADESLARAVRDSQFHFELKQYDRAEEILETSLKDPLPSDRTKAWQLLAQIRETKTAVERADARHREEEHMRDATAAAERKLQRAKVEATAIWKSINECIAQERYSDANDQLKIYRDHSGATQLETAAAIAPALAVITSPADAQKILLEMDDFEFSSFHELERLPLRERIADPRLQKPFVAALQNQIAHAKRVRAERAERVAASKRTQASTKPTQTATNTRNSKSRYDRILRSDDGGSIPVAANKASYDKLSKYAARGDVAAFAGLFADGLAWEIKSGTRVREVDPGIFSSEVEILAGKYKGKRGLVAAEFLK